MVAVFNNGAAEIHIEDVRYMLLQDMISMTVVNDQFISQARQHMEELTKGDINSIVIKNDDEIFHVWENKIFVIEAFDEITNYNVNENAYHTVINLRIKVKDE